MQVNNYRLRITVSLRPVRALLLVACFLAFLPSGGARADSGEQCRKSLSLDGKLATGANPDLVAEACLAAAAKSSNAQTSYLAGMVLEQGIGRGKDLVKAESWYRIAAEKGEPKAMLALGRLAENQKKNAEALSWYGAAATKQDKEAAGALRKLRIADPRAMWDAALAATKLDGSIGSEDEMAGSGSGIIVADNIVITNEHVVEGCTQMSVGPGLAASIVAKDAKRDLAILRTKVSLGDPAALADEAEIPLEMKLRTGGYPGIGDAEPNFVTTSGQRSTRGLGVEEDEYWLLTNRIDSGNSGGPLLDETGLIRGVVFASLPVTGIVKKSAPKTREGMAIRIDTVKAYLTENKIAFARAAKGPVAAGTAADMETHIAAVTVLVVCFQR